MRQTNSNKGKKKIKVHTPFLILVSLMMPFISYLLNPEGDREVSFVIMLVHIFIGAFALATEKGYGLWLIIVFEGALWRLMYSFGMLEGIYTQENLLWLAEKFLFYISYSLVFSAFFGFAGRFSIWFVKGGDGS